MLTDTTPSDTGVAPSSATPPVTLTGSVTPSLRTTRYTRDTRDGGRDEAC